MSSTSAGKSLNNSAARMAGYPTRSMGSRLTPMLHGKGRSAPSKTGEGDEGAEQSVRWVTAPTRLDGASYEYEFLASRIAPMRLKANKTSSQRELAIKLRVEQEANPGFFTWERRRLLIHAAKTALAAALCWWIAMLVGLPDGYWGAISAIIALQSHFA